MTSPVVTVTETTTPVTVTIAGRTVASTDAAWRLEEKGLADRWYVPRSAVDWTLFSSTDTSTHCPRKGDAVYWSFAPSEDGLDSGDRVTDVVWAYPTPLDHLPELADLVAFYSEKPEVELHVG